MRLGNYEEIDKKIENKINEIFNDTNITSLSQYEIRKRIFEHLIDSIEYDHDLLDKIEFNKKNISKKFSRNPYEEFETVMNEKKGVCNGIAQYYKLLLEKVGIYAFCINCMISYNGEQLGHQLNLVYDYENKTFSFDDVTMAILNPNKDKKMTYLDFDLEEANEKNEKYGMRPLYDNILWQILSEEYINLLLGRKNNKLELLYVNNILEEISNILSNEDFFYYNIIISKSNKNQKVM